MKIKVNIKPIVATVTSKREAVSRVSNWGISTFSTYGNYIAPLHDKDYNFAIVANYQLTNRKTKQVKNLKTGKTKSTVIRKKSWTVRIYLIPIELLKIANLKVIQKVRHFELVSRDKR